MIHLGSMEDVNEAYRNRFDGHKAYLSPEWGFSAVSEEENTNADAEQPNTDILTLCTNELSSYIDSHVQFRQEAMQSTGTGDVNDGKAWLSLNIVQNSTILEHSEMNFRYCKQLLRYLISTQVETETADSRFAENDNDGGQGQEQDNLTLEHIPTVFGEYMEYAPGPWREAAFVDVLINSIIPRLIHNRNVLHMQVQSQTQTQQHPSSETYSDSGVQIQDQHHGQGQQSPSQYLVSPAQKMLYQHHPESNIGDGDGNDNGNDNGNGNGNTSTVEIDLDNVQKLDKGQDQHQQHEQTRQDASLDLHVGDVYIDENTATGSASGSQSFTDGLDAWDDLSETASMISSNRGGDYSVHGGGTNYIKLANKLKKALHTINRLKAEIAMLNESLESDKFTDITTLQDKLRGAQADLSTVRRRNMELKDRVQTLEGSLFEALVPSTTELNNSTTMTSNSLMRSKHNNHNHNRNQAIRDSDTNSILSVDESQAGYGYDFGYSEDGANQGGYGNDESTGNGLLNASNTSIDSLTQKAKNVVNAAAFAANKGNKRSANSRGTGTGTVAELSQLRKKLIEYEARVSVLQAELDLHTGTSTGIGQNETGNIACELDVAPTMTFTLDITQLLNALPSTVSKEHKKFIEKATQKAVRTSKEIDRKTIDALLQENDRLNTALLKEVEESKQKHILFSSSAISTSKLAMIDSTSIDSDAGTGTDTGIEVVTNKKEEEKNKSNSNVSARKRSAFLLKAKADVSYSPPITMFLCVLLGFILAMIMPWFKSLRQSNK